MIKPASLYAKMKIIGKKRGSNRTRRDSSAEREFALHCLARRFPPILMHCRMKRTDDPQRFWIFDYAMESYKLFIEIDGGIWMRGAHAHPLDILRNMTKQNDAVLSGFAILRFTTPQVKNGYAADFTERYLRLRGWTP